MIRVTAAIIERNGKYLIGRRKIRGELGGKWEFPGGRVEEGENYSECLSRELKEELGRDFIIGNLFGESIGNNGNKKIKLIGYPATCNSTIFSLNSHDILRWVFPNEMLNYDFCKVDLHFVNKINRDVRHLWL